MKTLLAGLALLAAIVPIAGATHDEGCVPTNADPSTTFDIDLTGVGGGFYYNEERNVPPPFNTSPPILNSGFLLGDGSWLYEETNGVALLERGGIGLTGECFPPPPLPCLIIDEDPLNDENCGHGADRLIW